MARAAAGPRQAGRTPGAEARGKEGRGGKERAGAAAAAAMELVRYHVREGEYERIMTCIPPNPRRVGYIVPTHGLLDGPLYMGSIYTNR